jgi:tetratricopeptide (TPR) repeat protein
MTDSANTKTVSSVAEYETLETVAERYVINEDYEGLYDYCSQLIEKDSESEEAFYYRAISLYLMDEEPFEIIADLDRAIELDPLYVDALNARGHQLAFIDDFEAAAYDFETALAIAPRNMELIESLVDVYQEMQSWEDVVTMADYWIELMPDSSKAFYARGMAHIELEDNLLAIADLEKAAELYVAADRVAEAQDIKERIAELRNGGDVS